MRRPARCGVAVTAALAVCAALTGAGARVAPALGGTDPATWQQLDAPNTTLSTDSLAGVSCVSATDCVAVGSADSHALAARFDGTAWTVLDAPDADGEQNTLLSGVACPTASFCVAVGDAGSGSFTESVLETYDGSSWQQATLPDDQGDADGLRSVSCASASDCMAIGSYYDGSGYAPYSFHWDGSSWRSESMPITGSNFTIPNDVSCAGGMCIAVGSAESPSSPGRVYVARWDGTSWSTVSGAESPGSTDSSLDGVSCLSATSCVAAGEFFGGTEGTMVQVWDGTSWSLTEDTSASGFDLRSIACASATDCTAVGAYNASAATTFAEHFDGTSLSIDSTPDPDGQASLASVSCATTCLAVGVYGTTPVRAFALSTAAGPFAPGIDLVDPVAGPLGGGTAVTIQGAGFTGATAVHFGSIAATSFSVISDDEIDAVAPPCGCSDIETTDIAVTTPTGTSTVGYDPDEFAYLPAPSVSDVDPSSGAAGSTVTIDGSGFTDASEVDFGQTAADDFTVVSDSEIDATVPASATGSVDVTVHAPGGVSATGGGDMFTVVPAPAVTSVTPDRGSDAGGTPVTIRGSGFTGATAVAFELDNGYWQIGAAFTVVSDSEITATAPSTVNANPTFAGPADVVVTAPGGTSTFGSGDVFTYLNGTDQAPTAAFTASVSGLSASFDASGSSDADGSIVSYGWQFGDGSTATGATAEHTYAAAGSYTVTLIVTDDGGATAMTQHQVTVVAPSPPSSPPPSQPTTTAPASPNPPIATTPPPLGWVLAGRLGVWASFGPGASVRNAPAPAGWRVVLGDHLDQPLAGATVGGQGSYRIEASSKPAAYWFDVEDADGHKLAQRSVLSLVRGSSTPGVSTLDAVVPPAPSSYAIQGRVLTPARAPAPGLSVTVRADLLQATQGTTPTGYNTTTNAQSARADSVQGSTHVHSWSVTGSGFGNYRIVFTRALQADETLRLTLLENGVVVDTKQIAWTTAKPAAGTVLKAPNLNGMLPVRAAHGWALAGKLGVWAPFGPGTAARNAAAPAGWRVQLSDHLDRPLVGTSVGKHGNYRIVTASTPPAHWFEVEDANGHRLAQRSVLSLVQESATPGVSKLEGVVPPGPNSYAIQGRVLAPAQAPPSGLAVTVRADLLQATQGTTPTGYNTTTNAQPARAGLVQGTTHIHSWSVHGGGFGNYRLVLTGMPLQPNETLRLTLLENGVVVDTKQISWLSTKPSPGTILEAPALNGALPVRAVRGWVLAGELGVWKSFGPGAAARNAAAPAGWRVVLGDHLDQPLVRASVGKQGSYRIAASSTPPAHWFDVEDANGHRLAQRSVLSLVQGSATPGVSKLDAVVPPAPNSYAIQGRVLAPAQAPAPGSSVTVRADLLQGATQIHSWSVTGSGFGNYRIVFTRALQADEALRLTLLENGVVVDTKQIAWTTAKPAAGTVLKAPNLNG